MRSQPPPLSRPRRQPGPTHCPPRLQLASTGGGATGAGRHHHPERPRRRRARDPLQGLPVWGGRGAHPHSSWRAWARRRWRPRARRHPRQPRPSQVREGRKTPPSQRSEDPALSRSWPRVNWHPARRSVPGRAASHAPSQTKDCATQRAAGCARGCERRSSRSCASRREREPA